jgi:hypothetical protein
MKSIVTILTVISMFMVVGCVNNSACLGEYFPLIEGSTYTYRCTLDDGRIYVGTSVLRSHSLPDNTEVFYFDDGGGYIETSIFGLGCYYFENGKLWTIEGSHKDDLQSISAINSQLIGSELLPDSTIVVKSDDDNPITTLTAEGFESITIASGNFEKCLKINIHEQWLSGTEYNSTAWLAKDVGVVKWHRTTKRMDELVQYNVIGRTKGAWSISEKVRALAQETGIKQIHNLGFGSSHPLTGTTIYFSVYGDENVENSRGTIKRFSGSLDGETESFLSTKISTEHFVEITINETKARIHVDECDVDIAEGILKKFYALPHRCNCDTEDAEWHWCSNEAPEDLVPHFFAWDREKDEYQLWFSTGKNSGEGLRFEITDNMIVIIETSSWVS